MKDNKTLVALTGATGSMGSEALSQILSGEDVIMRLLMRDSKLNRSIGQKFKRIYKDRVEVIYGDLVSYDDCVDLVSNADFVFHCAAMIPPKSDHYQ